MDNRTTTTSGLARVGCTIEHAQLIKIETTNGNMIETYDAGLSGGSRWPVRTATSETGSGEPQSASNHSVQFYILDSQLERAIAHFAVAALADGEAVVIAATPQHRVAVTRLLASHAEPAQLRRVISIDAAGLLQSCLVDGQPDQDLFDQAIGDVVTRALTMAPRVAIYGELVALLSAEGNHDHALELEGFWHDLLARCPVSLLCGYDLRSFARRSDGAKLDRVCAAHDRVGPVEEPGDWYGRGRGHSTVQLQQRLLAMEREAEERERALVARNEELLAALSARDQFLMAAAHELKTPLTSLRVYAQLLQRDTAKQQPISPERLATACKAIERQSGQLNVLVDRLLDLGQIKAGSLRLSVTPSDLVAVVTAALAQFERSDTHRFLLTAPPTLPWAIDPVRLEQVVTILLANAVKFSPAGSRVELSVSSTPEGAVELSVSDEGRGVPAEHRKLIFERFHLAHDQQYHAGLGLSLPIARRIVELHSGSIHVESAPSGGARFVITLPSGAS